MSKIFKPFSIILVLAFGLILAFTSCQKDPEPMALPPAESLVIDWDVFPKSVQKSVEGPQTIINWFYSAATILVWNTAVALNIVVPTVAYGEAFNHTPVYLGDESWEWSYSVPVNNITYVARLVGTRLNNETFSMEMYLSQAGGFQDFEWFTGVIRYDHTEADWTLNQSPQSPVSFLSVHFEKDYETEVANIRYTVVDEGNDLYNGYIDYGLDPSLDLDAHYTLFKNGAATYIEWSTETKAGRVMDEAQFADAEWHCWDTQLQDVTCPPEEKQSLE